jgi:hypothetical protein
MDVRPSEEKFLQNFDDDGRMSMRPSERIVSTIHDDVKMQINTVPLPLR